MTLQRETLQDRLDGAPLPLDEFSDRYIKSLVSAAVSDAAFGYYPNGCPVLSEGPQKDDL